MKTYMMIIASTHLGAIPYPAVKADSIPAALAAYSRAVEAMANHVQSLSQKTLRTHADWRYAAVVAYDSEDEGLADLTHREIAEHMCEEIEAGNIDADMYVARHDVFPDEPVDEPKADAGTSEEPAKKPRKPRQKKADT